MDQAAASSSNKNEATIRADHLLEESKAIRRFAKLLGGLCVLLVFMVFGVDLALLEDLTVLVVHNVVAAVILICGLNVATVIYEMITTPVPGSPQDSSPSTPLQGLMRRPSHNIVVPLQQQRRSNHKRPDSIIVSVPQKRNSGGLFSGLWPRRKKRASSKDNNKNNTYPEQQEQQHQPYKSRKQKKISMGRRRGWPTDRLSGTSRSL